MDGLNRIDESSTTAVIVPTVIPFMVVHPSLNDGFRLNVTSALARATIDQPVCQEQPLLELSAPEESGSTRYRATAHRWDTIVGIP
jgi:hypothetical protein